MRTWRLDSNKGPKRQPKSLTTSLRLRQDTYFIDEETNKIFKAYNHFIQYAWGLIQNAAHPVFFDRHGLENIQIPDHIELRGAREDYRASGRECTYLMAASAQQWNLAIRGSKLYFTAWRQP